MNMEQMPRQAQEPRLNINDALIQITAIEQEERRRGRVDVEGDFFTKVRQELEGQEIDPEEAVRKARAFAGERQDY